MHKLSTEKTMIHEEGRGFIKSLGMILVSIYSWYIWGVDYDFLRWGFLGYMVTFGVITYIPQLIMTFIFLRDGVFSIIEQILFVAFNAALVYFIAPFVIGWFN